MGKTYFLKSHVDKIDALNDQLWYYLFATEELNKQLSSFSEKAKENFTTDLFKTNPHAKRIHIVVSSISKHQKENKNLTFGAYFATCYEIASKHIKLCFDTLKSFNSLSAYTWDRRKEPEKNLLKLLNDEGLAVPNANITDTITYLRHRRNHYTHIMETPNTPLLNFLMTSGARLNTHWRASGTTIHLDFSKNLVRDFTQEETIELIKLIRICVTTIDEHIAGLLETNSVIEYLVKREYSTKIAKLNILNLQKRLNKIRSLARTELGLTITDLQIQPYVNTIGVRR